MITGCLTKPAITKLNIQDSKELANIKVIDISYLLHSIDNPIVVEDDVDHVVTVKHCKLYILRVFIEMLIDDYYKYTKPDDVDIWLLDTLSNAVLDTFNKEPHIDEIHNVTNLEQYIMYLVYDYDLPGTILDLLNNDATDTTVLNWVITNHCVNIIYRRNVDE